MNKRAAILVALAALGVVLGRLVVRAALNALLGGTLFGATSYEAGADESQGVCPHWRGDALPGAGGGRCVEVRHRPHLEEQIPGRLGRLRGKEGLRHSLR